MARVAEEYQSQLARIKQNVEKSYLYWKKNADRFNEYNRFVFDTALDSTTLSLLKTLKKPQLEFNICEAYISRLRGEFAKQEPNIEVMAGDENPVDPQIIEIVWGHMRHIFADANKDGFEYDIMTDMLGGGWSVGKLRTDYANEMSFNQNILVRRAYDPVLCGFDPLAQASHKGDGNYCFELFPKTKEEFKREYPNISISEIKFTRDLSGFSWSYRNNKDDIILICDYYEKKKKKTKIVKLSNGRTMRMDEYKNQMKEMESQISIEQPPIIVDERYTEIETIVRYRLIENLVIEYVETDFKILPLIFFDGNSRLIRAEIVGDVTQMTRPYVYHAKGVQMLKNFAGQSLANELENLVQHKFKVARESIPNEEDYKEPYRNVQQADVLVYNYTDPNRPDVTLPAPQEIQRPPIPSELINTFSGADAMMQNVLGNFDMDIGKLNQTQVSGVALVESISQNNSGAMPYIVGFLKGLTRVAEGILDLIPKYVATPRTIPIIGRDGKRSYMKVNQEGGVNLNYNENDLNVRVEAGVNFSVQKSKALSQIISMMQASPLFNEFMNTEGLDLLLDNIEIKGIDLIKERAARWMEEQKQAKAQAQQAQLEQMQNNPQMMRAQNEAKKTEIDAQIKVEELKMRHEDAMLRHDATKRKADAEEKRAQIDLRMKEIDMHHKHSKERIEMLHDIGTHEKKEHKEKKESKK